MLRNIKRLLKYLLVFIGIVIMIPMILYPIVNRPEIQTFIIKRITTHLSQEINSTISAGKVEFIFFNKVNLDDFLVKDKNDDTLLYTKKISVRIRKINNEKREYTLGKATLINPVFSLVKDSTGILNLRWYIDLLKRKDNAPVKSPVKVIINQADIRNGTFSFVNKFNKRIYKSMDYNNLLFGDINGTIEDLYIKKDSSSFYVYNFSFRESKGFNVQKMNSDFAILNKNIVRMSSAFINCDSSVIRLPFLEFHPDSGGSYRNFTKNVRLNILLDKSDVYAYDMEHFLAPIKGMHQSMNISARVFGIVEELRGRDINILYGDNSVLDCDFDLSGLPKHGNSFIYIGVNQLTTNTADIKSIILPWKSDIKLPGYFDKMGTISFNGNFTGFTTDFVAYGKLSSDIGNIITDISLRPEGNNRFKIKGMVNSSGIDLGNITGNKNLFGTLSLKADVDMYAYSLAKFSGEVNSIVDSVEINGYKYRNISLNGIINDKTWDGSVKVEDNNITMDLLGMLNFSSELPEFNFTLNLAKADLYKLNLDKSDSTSSVSMLMTANFKGNSIENLDGEIKLLNSSLMKYGNILELYDFSLRSFNENGIHTISLRTDYIDADVRGYFNPAGMSSFIGSARGKLMPSRYTIPASKIPFTKDKLAFNINFKKTDQINNFFRTGLLISDKSSISGEIVSDTIAEIRMDSKYLAVKGNTFNDLSVDIKLAPSVLTAGLKSSSLNFLTGQSELKGFSADFSTKPDNFIFNIYWDNKDPSVLSRGNFTAMGTSVKDVNDNHGSLIMIDIAPTDIYNRNSLWKISHSTVILDSNMVNINNLLIKNEASHYLVDGTLSENPEDTLSFEFKSIDISPANNFIRGKKGKNNLSPELKGEINGKVLLTDIYHNPLIEGNLKINGFSVFRSEYGVLSLNSAWNNDRKVAEIHAENNLNGKKMIEVEGYYNPAGRMLDLTTTADKLPVDAANTAFSSVVSNVSGVTSGKIHLSGELNKLVLEGALMVENTSTKINFVQTSYKLNDSIRFDKNNISFRNFKLTDEKGNTAIVNGKVNHNYFKDFNTDISINFNNYMVLNTKPKDNDKFYGTAFITGIATIKTASNLTSIDVSLKTDRNTRLFVPLNKSETVSEYSFIEFVSPDAVAESDPEPVKNVQMPVSSRAGIDLNIDLEITPDAEIQIIFDETVGDVIKASGSGNLNVNFAKKGNLEISGDYIIESGDYLFTLGNVLNKSFSIENGGKLSFSGDINNAEIDLKAIYKLKASLYEILQDERFNERIPVECQIILTGKLFNPVVSFNIDLPSADEQRKTYLSNVITTEEELSRQFLYLLVMNSFYSDPNRISLTGSSPLINVPGIKGTSAMAVTTTEMLSHQLSNWLSQISNDFDIGFVYRPGYKDINAQEVEVALSTQLLNNRVTINGNFDVRGTEGISGTSDKITGDFDIEYKITEKLRFRFFNRFNNPYTGKGAPYTQGFGLFFMKDFDKFSDLFRKNAKSDMKKEEEPSIPESRQ